MTARLDRKTLRFAAEIVQAAYEEAMRRHGMLAGTISLISTYAQANLAMLDEIPEPDADHSELEALREALGDAGPHLKTSLRHGPDGGPVLHVNNPDIGGRFCEDITVGEARHYFWSWGDTLAPTGSPSIAAARIVHVIAPNSP
ncbi:hypothetical protein [Actinomadura gamaensis]|uniref:Uncharacterized protein n=1 Tax=Actinomadura gamaensis TaxID=1763541 RepID=A0ABV9TNV6_9ACTN